MPKSRTYQGNRSVMAKDMDSLTNTPFTVVMPAEQSLPFIFNSPHSGRHYTKDFLTSSRLNTKTIRRSEDLFVDELFADMPKFGAPLFYACFPRAFMDVNREPYELDPKMFKGRLPSYANIRSIRVAGGLGTIARVVSESQDIYRHRLSVDEALERIETFYKPYHAQLSRLIAQTHQLFQNAFLIDCHSMPSGDNRGNKDVRPDFVLGDRYGTSCSTELTDVIADTLKDLGYRVSRNKPYAGGFITEHYGRPTTGLHALQIEINRGLYTNEAKLTKNDQFLSVKEDLNTVFQHTFDKIETYDKTPDNRLPLAAE